MTIEQLYDWACNRGYEKYEIIACDYYGNTTNKVEPNVRPASVSVDNQAHVELWVCAFEQRKKWRTNDE